MTESFYNLNENLYKQGKGIDGSDILMSPLDMMNGVMSMGPREAGGSSGEDIGGRTSSGDGNSIDSNSNDAIDESNEGDKLNSKTNNDMGFTNNNNNMMGGSMNNNNQNNNNFNSPMSMSNNGLKGGKTSSNGLKGKTNSNGLKGKTNQNSPAAGGMMTILMKMNGMNGGGLNNRGTTQPMGNTKTSFRTTTSATIDEGLFVF